jgi:hypothetical protein
MQELIRSCEPWVWSLIWNESEFELNIWLETNMNSRRHGDGYHGFKEHINQFIHQRDARRRMSDLSLHLSGVPDSLYRYYYNGKINSSLCLIKNTCGDAFLTRTLEGSAQLSSHDNTLGMPTHCTGTWVGLKVGLDSTTMRILPPSANRTAVFQTVVSHCINWAINGDYSNPRHVI